MEKKSTFLKLCTVIALMVPALSLQAQDNGPTKTAEIYGFIMMDAGYNFDQIDPKWFDTVRPTKLPSVKNEHGADGNFYFSVRQTRLGFKNYFETPLGTLKTHFEFEMFGTGDDAGQTTIRLRHAYAELGKFGVGQYWSPFMDIDVFPNTVEYWGPNGMAFFRNVQVRYMPIQGDTRLTIALERPGASADQGAYADRIALEEAIAGHFRFPDLSVEYRKAAGFGYVEVAGILRSMEWEDLDTSDGTDLTGDALGWGLNITTNIKLGSENTVFRGGFVIGEGIQNYMNDAPVDVGVEDNTDAGNPEKPYVGVALPLTSFSAFIDHKWNDKFSSAFGYSMLDIDNSDGQLADAFSKGQYAAANLMYYPVENAMMGVELQWGDRENFKDDFNPSITKIQFSFKYNFSQAFYKQAQ